MSTIIIVDITHAQNLFPGARFTCQLQKYKCLEKILIIQ